jgi:hypothetical protein
MKVENGPPWARLKRIIDQIIEAMPDASPREMARRTVATHGAVVDEWALDLLTERFRTQRYQSVMIQKRPRLSHPGQVRLPGHEHKGMGDFSKLAN